tara:strand:- start:10131 stop:10268 length:138 start_codon:yes stop_codon:yes gene_type:complete
MLNTLKRNNYPFEEKEIIGNYSLEKKDFTKILGTMQLEHSNYKVK